MELKKRLQRSLVYNGNMGMYIYIYIDVLPEYNGTTGKKKRVDIAMYSLFNDDTREYIYIYNYIYYIMI